MPTRSGDRETLQLQRFQGITAFYARISDDATGEEAGVGRQLADCRALAERRQWLNTKEFIDNDISASRYSRKTRPAYRDMLERVRAGEVTRIVCYHLDRLYRQPKELEELIDLVAGGQVEIVTVYSGEVDLSNGDGVFVARTLVAVAAKASDDTSRRLRRKWDSYRAEGRQKPGRRAFGWVDKKTADPIEAAAIVDGIDRILAGETLADVARAWNKHGLKPPVAPLWTTATVNVVLTNPRHVGLLVHNGQVIGDGDWKPIVDRDRFERAGAVIASRQFSQRGGARADHWLSGVVFCGRCGQTLYHRSRPKERTWVCAHRPDTDGVGQLGCALTIRAPRLEAAVERALFERVDQMTLADLAAQPGGHDSEIVLELASVEARQAELGVLFAGGLNARAFKSASEDLDRKAAALRKRLEGVRAANVLGAYANRQRALAKAWYDEKEPRMPESRKREIVIAAFGRVTVNPHPEDIPRARFVPERIQYGIPTEKPNARS